MQADLTYEGLLHGLEFCESFISETVQLKKTTPDETSNSIDQFSTSSNTRQRPSPIDRLTQSRVNPLCTVVDCTKGAHNMHLSFCRFKSHYETTSNNYITNKKEHIRLLPLLCFPCPWLPTWRFLWRFPQAASDQAAKISASEAKALDADARCIAPLQVEHGHIWE